MQLEVQQGKDRALVSPRERQALELASRGQTNVQIAAEMGITIHAVKFHLASVYRKLGVANRTEAAVRFLEWQHNEMESVG